MSDQFVDEASVQYDDLRGTIALDDADRVGLERELAIDRDRWWLLGFSVYASEGFESMDIYLHDKEESGIKNYEDLQRVGHEAGNIIDVIAVSYPADASRMGTTKGERDKSPFGIMRRAFKRIDIVAIYRHQVLEEGHRLRITRRIESDELTE